MRILVVEDEVEIANALKQHLVEEGFLVDVAHEGETGLHNAIAVNYDAVVLDVMMPLLNGLEVLQQLRKTKHTPVLLLTARDSMIDKIGGLDQGADDYMTKPFDLNELVARLKSLIRRSTNNPSPELKIKEISVNTVTKTVLFRGEKISLSPKEYSLLEYLVMHPGQLITKSMIYEHIYDEDDDSLSNVIDVYMANIRKKLGKDFIETRRGQGYIVHV